MKEYLKTIFQKIIILVYYIYPYRTSCKLSSFANFIYSAWVRNSFFCVGQNFRVQKFSLLKGAEFISIGDDVKIAKGCFLSTWGNHDNGDVVISIGNKVNIGAYCHFTAIESIRILDGVLLGKWVTVSDNNHGDTNLESLNIPPDERIITTKGGVEIKRNVWIGEKVTILSGVTIGEGAVIAANSVVTRDIPPFSIAAGCPAKIIKNLL